MATTSGSGASELEMAARGRGGDPAPAPARRRSSHHTADAPPAAPTTNAALTAPDCGGFHLGSLLEHGHLGARPGRKHIDCA